MKTVFVSVFSNFVVRNILGTDFLKLLSRRGFKIVLLAPDSEKSYLENLFAAEGVIVEGVAIPALTARRIVLGYLSRALLPTYTVNLFLKLRFNLKRPADLFIYASSKLFGYIFGNSKSARKIARFLDYHLVPKNRFDFYFAKYRPDLVFSTDITDRSEGESDIDLIREAKKHKVSTVGMVRSWDNLTGRGIIREVPDRIVVHNEIIREQCVFYNNIPSQQIEVVGIPHYDNYLKAKITPREVFFQKIGLSPRKKTVLFVAIADAFLKKQFKKNRFNFNRNILEVLSKLDPERIQVLVRFPLIGAVDLEGFSPPANMFFDYPSKLFNKGELGPEADQHLVDLLANSDVILPGPSTIAVDALVFDRPSIFIGFDGREKFREAESIRKFFKVEHLRPLMEFGGVRIARSENELLNQIEDYLKNPELDRDERIAVLSKICWKTDGKSTERLVSAIVKPS